MKRLAAVLAALLLLAVPASAQTRAGVIWREGEAEPITETLSITAKPRSTDSLVKAKSVVGDTSYATFFSAVVVPTVS